jgi:lipopolysaccharide biosynthesis glycosyltransferase
MKLEVFNHKELEAKLHKTPAESSAIALCADSGFFAYTSVVILSLIKNGRCGEIPIFLFSETFPKDDIDKFRQLVKRCPCRLTLVELGEHDLKNLPAVRHMSRATYLRLFLPELLKKFEKILYLDSDTLVLSDVRALLDTNLDDKPLSAVRDLVGEKCCKIDFFRSGEKHYFNAGVLLINTKQWIRDRVGERVLELALNDFERERLSAFADQCLINFVVRGDFVELDKAYNWFTFEPRNCSPKLLEYAPTPTLHVLDKAKILHFTGHCKPWHPESSLGDIWKLYKEVAVGSPWGSQIEICKNPIPKAMEGQDKKEMKMHSKTPPRRWDYVSPNFVRAMPDEGFPYMIIGDVNACGWPWLRREIPHNWYSDRRNSQIGFASRDEAAILLNTAMDFSGRRCLEIGCWMGWSAAHLLLGNVELDIVDPIFSNPVNARSIQYSLSWAAKYASPQAKAFLHAGFSPLKVREIASSQGKKWAFAFIDGDHEGNGPLKDAEETEKYLEENALVLFHDLASPAVTRGLDFFKERGWNTMIYNTMQIMGVAWRGNCTPVAHQSDPKVEWVIPGHLSKYEISDASFTPREAEFERCFRMIKPYTMVGRERLKSLFFHAIEMCEKNIPGDFVECGTCRGGSAALLALVIKNHSKVPRKLFACDTYEGMPEPTTRDTHQGIPAPACGFPAGSLKAPAELGLLEIARKLGVQDITIPVKGFFRDTLPALAGKLTDIALLHADGDWYESTQDIFKNLYNKVSPNGFIQIDDYGFWEGCRQAVGDFQNQEGLAFNLHQIDETGYYLFKSNT